ncbi:hypothetical protein PROFUN_01105 [Planoprotostelium fungivorum]|uniref:Cyclin N-terminal domain-containing protein n=1 Tax=Planoprotostelium fungivorum TaxID=1890364 RepID=A0A2P6NCD4_9EUKA|nr:hypothetical protein PROFUN_01105 [Planoprotostelium fungivorum]
MTCLYTHTCRRYSSGSAPEPYQVVIQTDAQSFYQGMNDTSPSVSTTTTPGVSLYDSLWLKPAYCFTAHSPAVSQYSIFMWSIDRRIDDSASLIFLGKKGGQQKNKMERKITREEAQALHKVKTIDIIERIQASGERLRLRPQLAISTAIVFFHRFFSCRSFDRYDRRLKWRSHLSAFKRLFMSASQFSTIAAPDIVQVTNRITRAELRIVSAMGLDMFVEHPFQHMIACNKHVPDTTKELMQTAWKFIVQSYKTDLCLHHHPRTIGIASIQMAMNHLKFKSNDSEELWYEPLGVSRLQVANICNAILSVCPSAPQHPAVSSPSSVMGSPTGSEIPSTPRTVDHVDVTHEVEKRVKKEMQDEVEGPMRIERSRQRAHPATSIEQKTQISMNNKVLRRVSSLVKIVAKGELVARPEFHNGVFLGCRRWTRGHGPKAIGRQASRQRDRRKYNQYHINVCIEPLLSVVI